MKRYSEFVARHPMIILSVISIITIVMLIFAVRIRINPDVISYLPKEDNDVIAFDYISSKYGGNAFIMIGMESDEEFGNEQISEINKATEAVKTAKGVSNVISLTDVTDIAGENGNITVRKLIDCDEMPFTQEQLDSLSAYISASENYSGNIASKDLKKFLIVAQIEESADKIGTSASVRESIESLNGKMKYYYGGFPFVLLELSRSIVRDLVLLAPFAALMMVLLLFMSFRTVSGTLVPLVTVIIAIVWTVGLMSMLGKSFTIISNIIPVVLLGVGIAYSVHVLSQISENHFVEDRRLRISSALSDVTYPVFLAAVTTMAGFLSFIFGSYFTMIREFGIFAAAGVFFSFLLSITFAPAMMKFSKRKPVMHDSGHFLSIAVNWISGLERRRGIVVASTILIVLLSVFGMLRIERNVDVIDYFTKKAECRKNEEFIKKNFGGSQLIQVLIKGDMKDSEVMKYVDSLSERMKTIEGVSSVSSIAAPLKKINSLVTDTSEIPSSSERLNNAYFLIEGDPAISSMLSSDYDECIVQCVLGDAMKIETSRERINAIEAATAEGRPEGVEVITTGMPKLYITMDSSIIKSQTFSLAAAVIMIFIILLLMMKNLKDALIGLIPIVLTLIIVFGVMGIFSIPLDIATALVGSISIGIGIDYTIHFLNRFKEERKKSALEEALRLTVESEGRPILINMLTVSAGFIVMVFASLNPLRNFGILIAVTMLSSGLSSLIILPIVKKIFK